MFYHIITSGFEDFCVLLSFRINLSIPPASSEELKLEGATWFSRCNMYNVNYTEMLDKGIAKADPSWPVQPCQYGWTFNHTMIPYRSIAVEVNLHEIIEQ